MGSSASEALPRVGLPTYVEPARWGAWDRPAALLPHSYVTAVAGAGGLAVLLPPADPAAAGRALDGLDALILTGGADVDPGRYDAGRDPATQPPRPDRDAWESALALAALDRDLPLLAICRGAQVLNVALGGTLDQHLPAIVGHAAHLPEPGVFGAVTVRLAPGSAVAAILGAEVKVSCYHHQSLRRLGRDVEAVGWADDGTIEAAVVAGRRFAVAVQWHPEEGDDQRLFRALVAAA
ncbi:MAG TPA: gamma-glutamyl-gamma-aminobutyrate hydrolase family protein [Acidimicrobiales bacterium]